MLRKVLSTVFMLVVMLSLLPVSLANSTPVFKVENKLFVTPEGEPAPYINKDQRTMGSLRLVANALGVSNSDVSWDNATQTATLTKGERTVKVTVGKKELKVNGKVVVMDTKAEMKLGRVFIPARFIGESLGWYVGYDSISRAVLFSSKPLSQLPTNNIEEALGLTVVKELPITTDVNGLVLTLHEMWFYDYDSAEAKALNDKYEFQSWDSIITVRQNKPNLKAYVVQSKVTMKNDSDVAIKYDSDNRSHYYMFMTNKGVTVSPTLTAKEELYLDTNNTEMINTINIKPGESLTGYYYTIMHDSKPIDFISLTVSNKFVHDASIRIAEKE